MASFHTELKDRLANGKEDDPTRVLILHGLQRFRGLRTVEDFSFAASEGPPALDKQFEELLRDGPTVGLHVITGVIPSPTSIEPSPAARCVISNSKSCCK